MQLQNTDPQSGDLHATFIPGTFHNSMNLSRGFHPLDCKMHYICGILRISDLETTMCIQHLPFNTLTVEVTADFSTPP